MTERGASSSTEVQRSPFDLSAQLYTPCTFLHPTKELHATTLRSAQEYLGSLAHSINRSQNSRKRKRSKALVNKSEMLQINQLYVEGFTSDQIWEQSKRIMDSFGYEIELESKLNAGGVQRQTKNGQGYENDDDDMNLHADDGDHPGEDDIHMELSSQQEEEEPVEDIEHGDQMSGESEADPKDTNDESSQHDSYKEDPFGLNDGFFSIDDFNKQTESFERQDARGDVNVYNESDEEEVDWHADPLVQGSFMSSFGKGNIPSKRRMTSYDASESSDDEDGPTFGDADLFGTSDVDSKEGEIDENETGWSNTNGIRYSDFFAPPPRKASDKKARRLPRYQPDGSTIENDIEHAMADTRRDIFEDDVSIEEGDSGSGAETGQRSSHEKHRAQITDEIRRLEAANVAKKEWALAGEVRAADRPVNSLIEEDLEFERIGKPVPVVTNEVSEDIEELVRRRILAKEFDEVIRRRPGVMEGAVARKAERVEIDDSRPQKGLAELYEAEYLRATDPNYVDPKDQKLSAEHTDITRLWKEISSQLDTLSNWHYKPKTPQTSINVVTDAPAVSMEDARPTFASSAGGIAETLAPQEIYAPGDADSKVRGEVISKSGVPVSKDEMSREEKSRRRRQGKEQRKKASAREGKPREDKTVDKKRLVSDLNKGEVKVIREEGEITGVYGNKVQGENSRNQAGALKL